MKKYIYDESNGLWYELQGDYYIPCLKLPDEEQVEIGVWGQRHLEYIKHHRKGFYTALVLDCKLNRYLADINKQAEEMFYTLISQFKSAEGITEQLKSNNQLEWVCRMNNIRDRINEIIYKELIYV
ncbi:MAG: TnpV protein [Ruminococcaceae bacterium]|nr:TnpV protein [Oscillospiraceae bacterium]